jgi:4-amino-4-deoxy-L-arabinose transferase-like glycosyltransferase
MWPALLLGAIVLLALAFRLYRLDARSMWLDEIITAYSGRFDRLDQLMGYVRYWIDNTPLIFVQIWLLRGLGGDEIAIRLPFAIYGTLNIAAIYFLGKQLAGRRVGLLSALLMSVLPFAVWYSQEARHYAPLMLLTTLQMLFAYRAALRSRVLDWATFTICTILNVYTSYLALTATAVAYAFIGIVLLVELISTARSRRAQVEVATDRPPGFLRTWRPVLTKIAWAAVAGIVVGLAYIPWLTGLQSFLGRKDVGFGGLPAGYQPRLDDLMSLLSGFDLAGLSLLLAGIGLVGYLIGMRLGRWRQAALVLTWIVVSLVIFSLNAHWAVLKVPARYFSTLYPLAVLLVASGVDFVALAATSLARRISGIRFSLPKVAGPVTFTLLTLLLLAQAIPALADSYARPKDDYRGAAELIASSSPPDTVVIAMGMKSIEYFSKSLQYYLDLMHSPIIAEDAPLLDYKAASRLANGKSAAWGLVYQGLSADDAKRAADDGLDVIPLVGMALLRPHSPGLTPVEQAQALLRWGSASDPALLTSSRLLDAVSGKATLGPNLLPPLLHAAIPTDVTLIDTISGQTALTGTWALWSASARLPNSDGLALSANENEGNITITINSAQPGKTYLFTFRSRNGALNGAQRLFVSAHNGYAWLNTFPAGQGFLCDSSADWTSNGFAFTVPQNSAVVTVWLRVTGRGTADFEDVEMKEIR